MKLAVPNNSDLHEAIRAIARIFDRQPTFDVQVMLTIDNAPAKLQGIIETLLDTQYGGGQSETIKQPDKKPAVTPAKLAGGKTCKYCGVPIRDRDIVCSKEECRKKRKADYMQMYWEKKKVKDKASTEMEVPAPEPPDPLAEKINKSWSILSPDGERAISMQELIKLIDERNLQPGTMLRHEAKGLHQVQKLADGKLTVIRAATSDEAGL